MEITLQVIALFGGIQVIITGIIGFLAKVWLTRIHDRESAKLNEELEKLKGDVQATNQRLQAALEKSIYKQKVQFDTEFRIYSELWAKLYPLRSAIFSAEVFTSDIDERTWRKERASFELAHKNLLDAVETQKPFFSAKIAHQLFELINSMADISEMNEEAYQKRKQSGHARPISPEYVKKLRGLRNATDEICESIRERITGTTLE